MKFFAIITLVLSTFALLMSIRSIVVLQRMGMLDKEYLKHKGFKNAFAYLVWISIWLGAIGLLMQKPWGTSCMQLGLILFLILVLMTGIARIVGLVKMGWVKVEDDLEEGEEEFEQVEEEDEEEDFWDKGLKSYVFKGIAVSLIMMALFSGLVIWALLFLQDSVLF